MRILITAGPTRERIDPVRFISNRSSGKMGYALAQAARQRGHQVKLVSGPVHLAVPEGVERVFVESAGEMLDAVEAGLAVCDVLIMAAAVADWKPAVVSPQKMKKAGASSTLDLVRTPDILQTILPLKGGKIFVGFAAETENLHQEARRKLAAKQLDLIVANDVSRVDAGFEVDTNQVILFTPDGLSRELPLMDKAAVADEIMAWVESAYKSSAALKSGI